MTIEIPLRLPVLLYQEEEWRLMTSPRLLPS